VLAKAGVMDATTPSTGEICMIAIKEEKNECRIVDRNETDDEECPARTNRLQLVEKTFFFMRKTYTLRRVCPGVVVE